MVLYANHATRYTAGEFVIEGDVAARARAYAQEKFAGLARLAPLPILSGHVRFTRTAHRDPATRIIAEVNLDVNGRPVRAQVAASSPFEAVDLARDRLRRKLSQLGRHPARQGGRERAHRPGYAPRAVAQREVVRRKTFQPTTATLQEAEFDLELMDYDFLLFTDAWSNVDSVVARDGRDGYQVTVLRDVPRLTLPTAKAVLDSTDTPFVFYADAETGRGNVLYRRHDGNYGLITPAA
jgi:ribosome-associated translation inhibitor RaiA